jgi:hypothetical protein
MKKLACYTVFIFTVLIASNDLARADHIVFSGHTEGSFDGGSFSSTVGIPGLTFSGTSFALHTDEFGRLFVSGPSSILGNFVVTDANTLFSSCSDVICFHDFRLLAVFDSSIDANPVIVQGNIGVRPDNQVVAINLSATSFPFTAGEFSGTAVLGVGANNIRGFPDDGVAMGSVAFLSLEPPHPTPEPTTILLLGSATFSLMLFRRYR